MPDPDLPAEARPASPGAPHSSSRGALLRAAPSLVLIAAVSLAPLWGVLSLSWSVLAVGFLFVADGASDGLFVWRQAREARGGDRGSDSVLVQEFVKTYFVVIAAMLLILYMAFGGRLLKPGGEPPAGVYEPFSQWQFWALVAAFLIVRAAAYWWDWVRGGEAVFMPPAAVVAVPLRRLFLLQFLVLAGGLLVYWPLKSSSAGLAVLVAVVALAQVALAVYDRLRTEGIRAAVAAGKTVTRTPAGQAKPAPGGRQTKPAPRGGRKRRRGR
jgi:hypothetical protein